MLHVIITSNEIICNTHKVEAVSAVLINVQEHQMVQTLLQYH